MNRLEAIFMFKSPGEIWDAMKMQKHDKNFSDDLVDYIGHEFRKGRYRSIKDRLLYSFSDDYYLDEKIQENRRELATLNADELRIAANHNWEDTF